MAWSRRLEDPVALADGRMLVTLQDAADHIQTLAPAELERAHWQAAIEALILAAEDRGPLMHARIGLLRAIHHGQPAPAPRARSAKTYRIIR